MKIYSEAFLLAFICCLFSQNSRAVPGDEHWDKQFAQPGITNTVFAIASRGGKVYAAGPQVSGSTNHWFHPSLGWIAMVNTGFGQRPRHTTGL